MDQGFWTNDAEKVNKLSSFVTTRMMMMMMMMKKKKKKYFKQNLIFFQFPTKDVVVTL